MEQLTQQQNEIIKQLAVSGRSPEEVADKLGIKYGTLRNHLTNARQRSGANSLTQLIYLWTISEKGDIG